MTTLQTPFLSGLTGNDPIPHATLAYLRARYQNRLFEYVLSKFREAEKKGLTKAKLARRTHHRPEVITRLLGAPGNWTQDTATDLLIGICAEEIDPASSSLLDKAARNDNLPDWLLEPSMTNWPPPQEKHYQPMAKLGSSVAAQEIPAQ